MSKEKSPGGIQSPQNFDRIGTQVQVKIGDKIFVPDKKHVSDSVTGGQATIARLLQGGDYAIMEETEKIQWHIPTLLRNQELYQKQYKGQLARYYSEPFERDNFLW